MRIHLTLPQPFRLAIVGLSLVMATLAHGSEPARPADSLLRLVPSDAGLVLTVEGLRDWWRAVGDSTLVDGLGKVPAVRSWLESGPIRDLKRSAFEIESALGVKTAEIRDDLIGDAVVLALRLPPDRSTDPAEARGLLLLRARDPGLLDRLIHAVNDAQRQNGGLARVEEREWYGQRYHVRIFPEGSGRPEEWYVRFTDGTFAFSNSREMIEEVMDRRPADPESHRGERPARSVSLGDSPRLLAVRRRLPDRPLACLYIDPRTVERLLGLVSSPAKPSEARLQAMLRRHLSAVEYAGASLVWRTDTIAFDAVETLDAPRVEGWLRNWARDGRSIRPLIRRVPRSAVAMASIHVNFASMREAIEAIVADADHPRLRNLEIVLTGLFLGNEAVEVVRALGPGVVAFIDAPRESAEPGERTQPIAAGGRLFPMVVVVDIGGGPSPRVAADSLQNALKTVLALMAMDEKRAGGRASIVSTRADGVSILTLDVPIPFAFAVDRAGGRLLLGTSSEAVARALETSTDIEVGARFLDWQSRAFSGFETFFCVDLDALARLADRHRDRIVARLSTGNGRPAAEVGDELQNALALARLFRAVFVAGRMEPDASAIHRRVGLILGENPRPGS